jgi:hypothetical protein
LFPMPHFSRRGDERLEMGHWPQGGQGPLISSHTDVYSIHRGTSRGGGGRGGGVGYVHMYIRTHVWTDRHMTYICMYICYMYVHTYRCINECTDGQTEWPSICDEMRGHRTLWGRFPKGPIFGRVIIKVRYCNRVTFNSWKDQISKGRTPTNSLETDLGKKGSTTFWNWTPYIPVSP